MEECLGLGGGAVVAEGSLKEAKSKTGSTGVGVDLGGGAEDGVPGDLLAILREARCAVMRQRKEASHIVELERRFKVLDGLIQRASGH
jgi:hypothetical protein